MNLIQGYNTSGGYRGMGCTPTGITHNHHNAPKLAISRSKMEKKFLPTPYPSRLMLTQ